MLPPLRAHRRLRERRSSRRPASRKLASPGGSAHNAPVHESAPQNAGSSRLVSWRTRAQEIGAAVGRQPHLQAIRDGVVGALPLILLGSAFLLLWQPPWPGLSRVLPPAAALRAGYLVCAGLVSIYACTATALSLARRREVDPAASVTTSLAVFFVAQHSASGGATFALANLGA